MSSCKVDKCPDCFFKRLYKMIYSDSPVNLAESFLFLYKIDPDLIFSKKEIFYLFLKEYLKCAIIDVIIKKIVLV